MRLPWLALVSLTACSAGGASARFELANTTAAAAQTAPDVLADGTSLRLKIIAVYLAEDVDPTTMNNIGDTEMIWLNPQCNGDISGCNVDGFTEPAGGARITDYFDLARPTADVNADLNSQAVTVSPGSYKYARLELCKAYGGQNQATVPTMMWRGPGMADERPFTSGDCGRTSLAFDPPLELATGDSVAVTLGYDLATSIVSGAPGTGAYEIAGVDHWFRDCADLDDTHRACMDFPDFAPSAAKR
jgi:hypothetical protein